MSVLLQISVYGAVSLCSGYLEDSQEGSNERFKPRPAGWRLELPTKKLGTKHGKYGNEEDQKNKERDDGGHGVEERLDKARHGAPVPEDCQVVACDVYGQPLTGPVC